MKMKTYVWVVLIATICSTQMLYAQTFSITGHVVDVADTLGLINVSIRVNGMSDSNWRTGVVTDADGNFTIPETPAGTYKLSFSYLGYTPTEKNTTVVNSNVDLGTITLSSASKTLNNVTVAAKEIRATQAGDTTQFNANAYKTHPDASAEDLVAKMPGVTSDNTGVKVNGENVQQVLVDGKPFFGNDPTLALKNLPAEVIENIQIFDRQSDQSAFTGFDDGSSQKTMNITTKNGKSEGYFGKIYAGYGTDERYQAGGNLNIFHGERRLSILALSNNINQQNFSSQDLLGVSGGSSSGGRGGGSGRGMFGGGTQGGSGATNFLTGSQDGISTTTSVGINYSDQWGKKVKVSGSYFLNATNNTTSAAISRTYTDSSEIVYTEQSASDIDNTNHRFNVRLEYTVDSFNTLIFTPAISLQTNERNSGTLANTRISDLPTSITDNQTYAQNAGYNSNNNLLLQHKFKKQGRTLSLNLSAVLNHKTGDGRYYSSNRFFTPDDTTLFDQRYDLLNSTSTYASNLTYTEPIGKRGQLQVNYNPSLSNSIADKETFDYNAGSNLYDVKNITLSNKYNNTYNIQKGGVSYRVGAKGTNVMVGFNVQDAILDGQQEYPDNYNLKKEFLNILPALMFNKRYPDGRNIRIRYTANTSAPSIAQLQAVTDISNPLQLKTGNADLVQSNEHNILFRYANIKAKAGTSLFTYANFNYTNDYIGNATYLPSRDSVFRDQITGSETLIKRGSQLTRPVNLDGYYNLRIYFARGLPVTKLKSNLNFSTGVNMTRTPGILNDIVNYNNNIVPSAGIVLGSNINQNLDFSLSFTGNYNVVNNTLRQGSDNNYYNHTAGLKLNWIFLKHFVLNTNLTHNYYTAFSGTANQNFWLWNSYVGYKFMKGDAMEARISAFDLLNQNTSISRTVTANYIENNVTQVLQQYFMFQLTYTIRNFKGKMPEETKSPLEGLMPHGRGMRPDRGNGQ